MAAFVRIDQTGLSTGVAGKSRTVGLANGAQVTITNTNPNSKRSNMRLLAWPVGDSTANATLTRVSDNVFTFTPTASKYGTFRIEVTENPGTALQRVEVRIFGVRLPSGLLIPAPNERANPSASMLTSDASSLVDESEDNADDYGNSDLNAFRWSGWFRKVYELFVAAGGAAASAFTSLTDAPNSYTNFGAASVRVYDGETHLEFGPTQLYRRIATANISVISSTNVSGISFPSPFVVYVEGGAVVIRGRIQFSASGSGPKMVELSLAPLVPSIGVNELSGTAVAVHSSGRYSGSVEVTTGGSFFITIDERFTNASGFCEVVFHSTHVNSFFSNRDDDGVGGL